MGGAIQGVSLNLSSTTSTLAGPKPNADGQGSAARFGGPNGVASDGTNLYVTNRVSNNIRKIVIATGVVTTLAGKAGVTGNADGVGAAASFTSLQGIAAVGGNLYVLDSRSIRKVVIATGEVTTLVEALYERANDFTSGIASDGQNLYVLLSSGGISKVVIATGSVSTLVAGDESGRIADGKIVVVGANLYVTNHQSGVINKIVIATGEVIPFAGHPVIGPPGDDGIGVEATFYHPTGIATDGSNLYVADTANAKVRKIVIATAAVTTITDTFGIEDIVFENGYLYATDAYSIQKIELATSTVTTLAGAYEGKEDGIGAAANFNHPSDATTDGANLYVADTSNNSIRKIVIATGAVSTLAGGGQGYADGVGAAASFFGPMGITTDGRSLYVADTHNNSIRKVAIDTGEVSTLAGGSKGFADGVGAAASFYAPTGITTDGTNLYVTDSFNASIRKVVISTGAVSTLSLTGFDSIAPPVFEPRTITTDGTNLYVISLNSNIIYKIAVATGNATIMAGAEDAGSLDAIGGSARFNLPDGMTTDGRNLYVSDHGNFSIRKIAIATGEVSTVVGGGYGGDDGAGMAASFSGIRGITTDGHSLFITDIGNNNIRKID